ncbi:MAG: SPOR domain-containing protein [Sphingobacteriales bacterium]|nr:SPOR domain-containing protein [Sphingobacteriales bacterium]
MNKFFYGFFFLMMMGFTAVAQVNTEDSVVIEKNIMHKDPRIDVLGNKMAEYNESLALKIKIVSGYRLMLLNTTDREAAMKLRTILLQQYPEHKLYMSFLAPYIKLKMGNFIDKAEAEKMRKELQSLKIVTGNIYLVNEKIELKPVEKNGLPVED